MQQPHVTLTGRCLVCEVEPPSGEERDPIRGFVCQCDAIHYVHTHCATTSGFIGARSSIPRDDFRHEFVQEFGRTYLVLQYKCETCQQTSTIRSEAPVSDFFAALKANFHFPSFLGVLVWMVAQVAYLCIVPLGVFYLTRWSSYALAYPDGFLSGSLWSIAKRLAAQVGFGANLRWSAKTLMLREHIINRFIVPLLLVFSSIYVQSSNVNRLLEGFSVAPGHTASAANYFPATCEVDNWPHN